MGVHTYENSVQDGSLEFGMAYSEITWICLIPSEGIPIIPC